MIHAGTMRIGSGWTVSVVGVYWISSIRRFFSTTLPGVTATSRPTTKFSVPAGGLPAAMRSKSSRAWSMPRTRLAPPLSTVRCSTAGLLGR
ncbi:hypothetical protein D3C72_1866110 [compost metagenome]